VAPAHAARGRAGARRLAVDSSCELHEIVCYGDLRMQEMATARATAVREIFREGEPRSIED